MLNSQITVVPVHGAWAECASWNEIILPLQKQGLKVVCAPIPLTARVRRRRQRCHEK
jgi:hypothetical protein